MRGSVWVPLAVLAGCSVDDLGARAGDAGAPPAQGAHAGPGAVAPGGGGGDQQVARTLSFEWRGSASLPGLNGLALQPGGENASVGMGSLTCTVSTLTGNYTDDDDYLPDDEDPQDWDDNDDDQGDDDQGNGDQNGEDDDQGNRLLMLSRDGTVGIRASGFDVTTFEVAGAKQAAFVHDGALVYSESAMGCRLTHLGDDGVVTGHDLPIDACGSRLAVDKVTGTAWLANGDLWSVDADGVVTLEAEDTGDLVAFEPTTKAPVTAYDGGTVVTMLGRWTADTTYAIHALSTLQEVGAVVALTDAAAVGSRQIVGIEAGWGGSMGAQVTPNLDATLAVDGDGTTLGLVMDGQAVFYRIAVD